MANENNDDMKEFEEEFDFESEETKNDALPIEDEDALSHPNAPDNRSAAQGVAIDKKPSKLPWLIGLAAVGFIGWQGYKIIFAQPTDEVSTPVVKQESKSLSAKTASDVPTVHAQNKPATLPVQNQPASNVSATPQSGGMPDSSMGIQQTPSDPSKTPDLFSPPPATTGAIAAPKPNQLDVLDENMKKSQERMNKLESKFSELMDSMGSLNQGMSQVTRELSTISDSVQKLNKDVKTLKSQAQQPTQAAQSSQALKQQPDSSDMQPIYSNNANNKYETKSAAPSQTPIGSAATMSVHAIIPGRAWLKSKDGSTLTVTEGDTLDRYGKVLVIDASNGVVITSSGVTLR